MSLSNKELRLYLDGLLKVHEINDFCPNGLQVEGKPQLKKIVTGVTASQALIDEAVKRNADAILVHHGYFWKGEAQPIVGMKKRRIKSILDNDLNLFAYHLPLDVHPEYGNNRQLAKLLNLENISAVSGVKPTGVVMKGELPSPMTADEVAALLSKKLNRHVLCEDKSGSLLSTLAWCTGGGQGYIETAVEIGVDGFITGEVSEQTIHTAREMDVAFFAAGHHATERYGIKALGEHLKEHFSVDVEFVDIDNPA